MKKYLIFSFALTSLAACSDKEDTSTDTRHLFEGSFQVEEQFIGDDEVVDFYQIELKAGVAKNELEINNFEDFMYVAVKAHINGQKFSIKPQVFEEHPLKLNISGEGELHGDTILFTYQYVLDNVVSGYHSDIECECTGIRE